MTIIHDEILSDELCWILSTNFYMSKLIIGKHRIRFNLRKKKTSQTFQLTYWTQSLLITNCRCLCLQRKRKISPLSMRLISMPFLFRSMSTDRNSRMFTTFAINSFFITFSLFLIRVI